MAIDLSSKNPPPSTRRQAQQTRNIQAAQAKAAQAAQAKLSNREEALNGLVQTGAMGLLMLKQTPDAMALAEHGPKITHELAELGETNEGLGNFLDRLAALGPYSGLVVVSLPFILQILVNHGRLPAAPLQDFGVKDPRMLQAQAEVQAIQRAREIEHAQREAERQLAELQREMTEAANGKNPTPEPVA